MTVSNSIVSILFAAILSVLPGCAEFPLTSEAAGFLFGTAAASVGFTTRQGFSTRRTLTRSTFQAGPLSCHI